MSSYPLTYDVLLAYTDAETDRWREWFAEHPAAINAPFGDGRMATVGGLLAHMFSVELRHTQRLLGREVSNPDDLWPTELDTIFAMRDQARVLLDEFLTTATEADFAATLTFPTLTAGPVAASKRKIATNIFLHGIRHWGQVASAVRRAGFADQWPHDLLLSAVAF